MPIGSLFISKDLKKQILLDLCHNNRHADLDCTPDNSTILHAKIRFLGLSENGLILDQPTISGEPLFLKKNEFIHVRFIWENQHYAFTSQVQIPQIEWALNDSLSVPATRVKVPRELMRTQRRKCFRLGLAHLPPVSINLCPIDKTWANSVGTIVNISEGGASILLEIKDITNIAVDNIYEACFSLPYENNQLTSYKLIGTIRRMKEIPEKHHFRIGITWNLSPSDHEIQSRLGKFIVAEQLRILSRKREINYSP